MQKTVLDISYANPIVDFVKVKASGISDVIIRTGYLNKTDTHFDAHMQNAIKNKFNIGVYTYIMSKTVAEAKIEAEQTLARLEKYKGFVNYPVFCDMEDERYHNGKFGKVFDKRLCTDIIKTFCNVIRKGGYYSALYINPAWLEQYTYKNELVGKYDIWLAAWTGSDSKPTRYNYNQTMWQWGVSDVDGINGAVDTNMVYVDYPSVIRKNGLNYLKPFKNEIDVNYIMQSFGTAAIRKEPKKSGILISRVAKEKYYPIDKMVISDNKERWLRHAGTKLYSMYIDGAYLFKKVGTYTVKTTTETLNIRNEPSISGRRIITLSKNTKIYVFNDYSIKADNYTWVKVLINNDIGYVASEFLK